MAVNQVKFGNTTVMDITDTTATAEDVASGKYFYNKAGVKTLGTASGGGAVVITEEQDVHGGTITHITADVVVSGTKQITTNGTHDVSTYSYAEVNVSSSPNLQDKTVAPTESQQVISADSGYDGLDEVTVSAISSTYVGTGVTRKSAATYHPSTSDQSIASSQYLTGAQTIKAVTTTNLLSSNILSGVTVKVGDSTDDDCVASVTGNVSFKTYYTGSSAPSSSLGVDGDIYLQS